MDCISLAILQSISHCNAKCKARGGRCRNTAAYGMPMCKYDGSHEHNIARPCEQHSNYQHGRKITKLKAVRSAMLAELRALRALSFAISIASSLANPKGDPSTARLTKIEKGNGWKTQILG